MLIYELQYSNMLRFFKNLFELTVFVAKELDPYQKPAVASVVRIPSFRSSYEFGARSSGSDHNTVPEVMDSFQP
jgi:hypothetical protein